MSEKELQRLYDLLEKVTDENEKVALRHAIFIIEGQQQKVIPKIWKYIEIKSLREAKKDEKIVAYYPNPMQNRDGYKTDECIKLALKDAKQGKCKLLIWREVEDENFYDRLEEMNNV
jgi:hypothetical protein